MINGHHGKHAQPPVEKEREKEQEIASRIFLVLGGAKKQGVQKVE